MSNLEESLFGDLIKNPHFAFDIKELSQREAVLDFTFDVEGELPEVVSRNGAVIIDGPVAIRLKINGKIAAQPVVWDQIRTERSVNEAHELSLRFMQRRNASCRLFSVCREAVKRSAHGSSLWCSVCARELLPGFAAVIRRLAYGSDREVFNNLAMSEHYCRVELFISPGNAKLTRVAIQEKSIFIPRVRMTEPKVKSVKDSGHTLPVSPTNRSVGADGLGEAKVIPIKPAKKSRLKPAHSATRYRIVGEGGFVKNLASDLSKEQAADALATWEKKLKNVRLEIY